VICASPHGQLTPATKAITFYGTSFIADETGAVVAELDDSEDKVRGSGLGSAHTRQNVHSNLKKKKKSIAHLYSQLAQRTGRDAARSTAQCALSVTPLARRLRWRRLTWTRWPSRAPSGVCSVTGGPSFTAPSSLSTAATPTLLPSLGAKASPPSRRRRRQLSSRPSRLRAPPWPPQPQVRTLSPMTARSARSAP